MVLVICVCAHIPTLFSPACELLRPVHTCPLALYAQQRVSSREMSVEFQWITEEWRQSTYKLPNTTALKLDLR